MTAGRSLRQIAIVLKKELKDSLRDRRALWSIVFSMTIGPVLIGFMMNRVAAREHEAEHVRIPVVGIENAPTLVDWLNQQAGVIVVDGPVDAEQAVRDRSEDVVMIVPKDFSERFRQSRPARLKLVVDNSRNDSRPTIERVRRLLGRALVIAGADHFPGAAVLCAAHGAKWPAISNSAASGQPRRWASDASLALGVFNPQSLALGLE